MEGGKKGCRWVVRIGKEGKEKKRGCRLVLRTEERKKGRARKSVGLTDNWARKTA